MNQKNNYLLIFTLKQHIPSADFVSREWRFMSFSEEYDCV